MTPTERERRDVLIQSRMNERPSHVGIFVIVWKLSRATYRCWRALYSDRVDKGCSSRGWPGGGGKGDGDVGGGSEGISLLWGRKGGREMHNWRIHSMQGAEGQDELWRLTKTSIWKMSFSHGNIDFKAVELWCRDFTLFFLPNPPRSRPRPSPTTHSFTSALLSPHPQTTPPSGPTDIYIRVPTHVVAWHWLSLLTFITILFESFLTSFFFLHFTPANKLASDPHRHHHHLRPKYRNSRWYHFGGRGGRRGAAETRRSRSSNKNNKDIVLEAN